MLAQQKRNLENYLLSPPSKRLQKIAKQEFEEWWLKANQGSS